MGELDGCRGFSHLLWVVWGYSLQGLEAPNKVRPKRFTHSRNVYQTTEGLKHKSSTTSPKLLWKTSNTVRKIYSINNSQNTGGHLTSFQPKKTKQKNKMKIFPLMSYLKTVFKTPKQETTTSSLRVPRTSGDCSTLPCAFSGCSAPQKASAPPGAFGQRRVERAVDQKARPRWQSGWSFFIFL